MLHLAVLTPRTVVRRTYAWALPPVSRAHTSGPVPDLPTTATSDQLRPTGLEFEITERTGGATGLAVEMKAVITGPHVKTNGTSGARTGLRVYYGPQLADLPAWARTLIDTLPDLPELPAAATA